MICLSCGDCCKRMSPLEEDNKPCRYLRERTEREQTAFMCANYDWRPEECRNHDMPAAYCPVGIDVLDLEKDGRIEYENVYQRIKWLEEIKRYCGNWKENVLKQKPFEVDVRQDAEDSSKAHITITYNNPSPEIIKAIKLCNENYERAEKLLAKEVERDARGGLDFSDIVEDVCSKPKTWETSPDPIKDLENGIMIIGEKDNV